MCADILAVHTNWLAQIILSEQLQVPVVINDKEGSKTDYYRSDLWDEGDVTLYGSVKEPYAALKAAFKDPHCTSTSTSCGHCMLEIWKSPSKVIEAHPTLINGGILGMFSKKRENTRIFPFTITITTNRSVGEDRLVHHCIHRRSISLSAQLQRLHWWGQDAGDIQVPLRCL